MRIASEESQTEGAKPRPWHVLSDGTDALPDVWDAKTRTWKSIPPRRCGQCEHAMNPVQAAMGPVCGLCCDANHQALAGEFIDRQDLDL